MVTKKVKVRNKAGIHCRPAGLIIQKIIDFPDCSFSLKCSKGESDLTSILALLSLALEQGEEIEITVNGPDEENVCTEIAELFAFEFDFLPQP
jgi:phosphocarrier protein HPr